MLLYINRGIIFYLVKSLVNIRCKLIGWDKLS